MTSAIDLTNEPEGEPRTHIRDNSDEEVFEDGSCGDFLLVDDYDLSLGLSALDVQDTAHLSHNETFATLATSVKHHLLVTDNVHGELGLGMTVELYPRHDFMFILDIIEDAVTHKIKLRGIHLRRNRDIEVIAPKKGNEVSAVLSVHIDKADQTDPSIFDAPIEREISQVVAKRELIFTNQAFPAWRAPYCKSYQYEETARLVCRAKYIQFCSSRGNEIRVESGAVINISQAECHQLVGKVESDVAKWLQWLRREQPVKPSRLNKGSVIKEAYTYADICAGGGGATRAAAQSGLKVKFVLDHWSPACQTLRGNFPGAHVFEMDIFDFLVLHKQLDGHVEIMHISFPCQPYSGAHRNFEGSRDGDNIATGYSADAIIERCRPRVVTFEQTAGLMTMEKHRDAFNALIMQITSKGYSARWKILSCDRYGNVQARKRLFLIAACPGEPLPPFPLPTHGIEGNLARLVTVADRLAHAREQPGQAHMQRHRELTGTPYDADLPLRHCLMSNCGYTPHPSGRRCCTLQEIALLAGFPAEHRFADASFTDITRQIGNAVPGCAMRAVLKPCIKSMQEWDKTVQEYSPDDAGIVLD